MTEAALIRAADLGQDLEDKVAPNGSYDLRITSSNLKTAKSERQYIAFSIAIEGSEDYASIFHNLMLPVEADEARTRKMFLRDTARFFKVFGIPLDTDITEEKLPDLVGSTGKCLTKQVEVERDGHKTGDFQSVLVLPKLT